MSRLWPRRGLRGDTRCGAPDPKQVETARAFLSGCVPVKTRPAASHSYGLKHAAERWGKSYVSNGALIQAAIDLGLRVEPGSINAWVFVAGGKGLNRP